MFQKTDLFSNSTIYIMITGVIIVTAIFSNIQHKKNMINNPTTTTTIISTGSTTTTSLPTDIDTDFFNSTVIPETEEETTYYSSPSGKTSTQSPTFKSGTTTTTKKNTTDTTKTNTSQTTTKTTTTISGSTSWCEKGKTLTITDKGITTTISGIENISIQGEVRNVCCSYGNLNQEVSTYNFKACFDQNQYGVQFLFNPTTNAYRKLSESYPKDGKNCFILFDASGFASSEMCLN